MVAKLRASRLTKAAELVERALPRPWRTTFPEAHWQRVRTNSRSSAFCARSGDAHASSGPSLMDNRR